MANLSKLELLVNFGFKNDPFKSIQFKTGDGLRIKRILDMAVKSNAFVSIVGNRGAGKTRAVATALKDMNALPVVVRSADKARLLISDIEQAMLLDLSEEKPKRGREVRSRQLRRVLGEASRKQFIVVIIEEGHRLHGMTLRALKTLREIDWMGETELFSVVLLGQSDPMNKAGMAEVRLRADSVEMYGLSKSEIAAYIEKTVGHIFETAAIDLISAMPEARNFLDLQNIIINLMRLAATHGRKQVTQTDIHGLFGVDVKKPGGRKKTGPISDIIPGTHDKNGNRAALHNVLDRAGSQAKKSAFQEAV
jgi:type II secretory pathway predicted ATPase ExeA